MEYVNAINHILIILFLSYSKKKLSQSRPNQY